MFWFRRNRRRRRLPRRLGAGLTLVAYLAVVLGLPLPTPLAKDRSQPFPCQDHPCGCRTAEECWRHCCCFTPEERLAWAREHHVEPPAYAELPTARGWHEARLRDREQGAVAPAAGCAHCGPKRAPAVASTRETSGCCSKATESAGARKSRVRGGLSLRALYCKGQSPLFTGAAPAVLPPPFPTGEPFPVPAGRVVLADTNPVSLPVTPPDPPPRGSNARA